MGSYCACMIPDDHGQLDADDVRKGSSARCDRCGNVHVDGEPHVLSGRTCNTCGYWVCGVCCASLLPSPTLAAAKGAFETIRVPYSYPSSLNILHAGKQSEARGGDVAQIGFIACGSDIDKVCFLLRSSYRVSRRLIRWMWYCE